MPIPFNHPELRFELSPRTPGPPKKEPCAENTPASSTHIPKPISRTFLPGTIKGNSCLGFASRKGLVWRSLLAGTAIFQPAPPIRQQTIPNFSSQLMAGSSLGRDRFPHRPGTDPARSTTIPKLFPMSATTGRPAADEVFAMSPTLAQALGREADEKRNDEI